MFLRDTPTLGVRVRPVGRYVADRDTVTVETEYGPMRVKRKWLGGEVVSAAPEYEDVAAAARERGVGWSAVSGSDEWLSRRRLKFARCAQLRYGHADCALEYLRLPENPIYERFAIFDPALQ